MFLRGSLDTGVHWQDEVFRRKYLQSHHSLFLFVLEFLTKHSLIETVLSAASHRFDVLFGDECRGADGQFTNIHGDCGMTAVVLYLQSIHSASAQIPLDLAVKRLPALDKDLHITWCVFFLPPFLVLLMMHRAGAAKPTKKSKRVDKPDETPGQLVQQA
ncbi:hypothetical protein K438DRAFT_1787391 [Mycena galopus ATCC 62051]|nr:hypothetical protein K438DRAFT_1787391 [Mycena galopus ATCC 62051]